MRALLTPAALTFLLALTLVWALPGALRGESVTRANPETPGEKRLLEWDLNKSYDFSRGRLNPAGKASSRTFLTRLFKPESFSSKTFSTESFSSREFLLPESRIRAQTFSKTPAVPVTSSNVGRPFNLKRPDYQPESASGFPATGPVAPKGFEKANLNYSGPEAHRKDLKYSPSNAPKGGVIEGRALSIDEVREILNKSK